MNVHLYEVGGCVRDELLSIPCKDVDYAVEASSFDEMRAFLLAEGFTIFLETEEFLTIRAKVPKLSMLAHRTDVADFVLCRKDSPGSDGRRPDYVIPGTIFDDLARRDFTVNAMARDVETNKLLDPHDGINDLMHRYLQFVGSPRDRIREDGLRVLRGMRFMVTKGLQPTGTTAWALHSELAAEMLSCVSIERIREELVRMFRYDTQRTLGLLVEYPRLMPVIFRDGLWLEPTLKET